MTMSASAMPQSGPTTGNGVEAEERVQPVTKDPYLFFASPVQFWASRLVNRANKAKVIEDDWLPVFSRDSDCMRLTFAKLRQSKGAKWSFFCQWEIGGMLLLGGICEVLRAATSLGAPLILSRLLNDTRNVPLAWALVIITLAATLFGRAKDQVCRTQSTWVEQMLRTSIFDKSLRLSPAARTDFAAAKIINMSEVDVNFVSTYFMKVHDIWSCPLQLVAIAGLTSTIMGPVALFGFLFMFILFFAQGLASKTARSSVIKFIKLNDDRLGALRDLLSTIKSVKALAYEHVFRQIISETRTAQVKAVGIYLSVSFGLFTAISQTIPGFTASAAFIAYYVSGHQLTAAVVFPAIAYFNLLYTPVQNASLAITRQFAVRPSVKRIWTLMTAEDSSFAPDGGDGSATSAVNFQDSSFTFPGAAGDQTVLAVGELSIPSNQFTAVIGPTGSGKSSLLQAILGELPCTSGTKRVHGSVSYSGQTPWIISGTLRDNIVFMSQYEKSRYDMITRMCGLDYDFRTFPGADQAVVAESGSNLSGGQRARIGLARALYMDPDIFLLDDPFSAVDGKTKKLLFETLRSLKKTIILVTQHTPILPRVDNVVVMGQNQVSWSGPSRELLADDELRDGTLGKDWRLNHEGEAVEEPVKSSSSSEEKLDGAAISEETEAAVGIVEKEERAEGTVRLRVVGFYARAAGGILNAIFVLLTTALLIGTKIMGQYWFVWWIDGTFGLQQVQYLGGYLGLTLGSSLVAASLGLILCYASMRASRSIHEAIVDNLLSAPLWFFQQHPIGRILNRLSTDIESIDTKIMNGVDGLIVSGTTLIASLALIASSSAIMVAAVVPYIVATLYFESRFRITARELQRSVSILQSPVTTVISEALHDPTSVKAYNAEAFVVSKHGKVLDTLISAKLTRKSLDTWVTFRAEVMSVLLLLVTAMLTCYGVIPPVQAGLALSMATTLANNLYLLAWAMTDLEIQMNSVERLKTYRDDLPAEEPAAGSGDPPKDWPQTGVIEMKNAVVQYASRTSPALDGVNLSIPAGQRVGIVGRTGCGKTTLISSITRLVDLASGTITIGGQDVSQINPRKLRGCIRTLPQEPLILAGTIRRNLDPDSHYRDGDLLTALEICQLRDVLTKPTEDKESRSEDAAQANPLEREIASGGTDLSAGQRQLLSAARLLISKPTILLVDEVAANVDSKTDIELQKALQAMPPGTTLLCIAHRAASLAWMDRVLVMEAGHVVEDNSPLVLLEGEGNEGSQYRQAVMQEGEGVFRSAVEAARETARGKGKA